MKKAFLSIFAAALAGCATIKRANDYHGALMENGETPIETIEIENTCWLLFAFLPLGSGNPYAPDVCSYTFLQDTATLDNNLMMLKDEANRVNAKRVLNLTSRVTNESLLLFLLTRKACHTSAVLLK